MCDIRASSASCNISQLQCAWLLSYLSFYNSLRKKGWLTLQVVMFWGQLCFVRHFRLGNLSSIITRKSPDWAEVEEDLRLELAVTHSTFTMQPSLDRSGHWTLVVPCLSGYHLDELCIRFIFRCKWFGEDNVQKIGISYLVQCHPIFRRFGWANDDLGS
jgi:hypothetical protein